MNIETKAEYQSVLTLKNLYFEKIDFKRPSEMPKKFSFDCDSTYRKTDETEFEVKLTCNIFAEDQLVLDIVLVGIFDNKGSDPEVTEEINEENTVAIMFPYLRAEISLITAQPNFPTLNLPPMNINAMMADKRGQKD